MPRTLPISIALLAGMLFCHCLYSQNDKEQDNNITISSKKETYEFKQDSRENPVIVKQQYSVTYYCNQFRASIPFVESYDDRTSIDDVNIRVDGIYGEVAY